MNQRSRTLLDRRPPILRAVIATCSFIALAGCDGGGTATVEGRVTDGSGQQPIRALAAGELGGSGTVSAASTLQVSSLGPNGTTAILTSTQIEADGTYSISVPANQTRLLLEAANAEGEVLASGVLDSSGSAGSSTQAPPVDRESSVEAEVMLAMLAQGVAQSELNTIDLRSRVNAETAAEVAAASGTERSDRIEVLAEAVTAAQQAKVEAYQRRGISVTQSALFEAHLSAAQALNAQLHAAGTGGAGDAYATFFAAIGRAEEDEGAEPEEQAEAEKASGAAFRTTVDARASLSAGAFVDAAARSSAVLEAYAVARATEALFASVDAASSVQADVVAAGNALTAEVEAASSASAAADAFADFSVAVTGGADVESGLLGLALGVDATNEAQLQAAVDVAASASSSLGASLQSALNDLIGLVGSVNLEAHASDVVDAYAAYRTAVEAEGSSLTDFGTDAEFAVDVLLVAEGSFQ